ncbi:hypothetical protein PsorP6_016897 [Peronosclerospora sorghi]|uniref:Uncharacterized protein n=1 Tax=Peronosclerospora sorghi TaxID=230839 RepID=A0ACC0WBR0_9STRA|nr:hypothetical protein PsorP6_016897 [Peronosclerospora sorghi]
MKKTTAEYMDRTIEVQEEETRQRKLGDIASDVRRLPVAPNELDTNLDTIFAYQMELKSTLVGQRSLMFRRKFVVADHGMFFSNL